RRARDRGAAHRLRSADARALFAAVVAGARPRRKRQQHAGAGVARHGAALVRVEAKELALAGVEGLAPDLDAHAPADDEYERSFLHLVLAELLACVEADEHGATHSVLGVEHDGRAGAVRGVDLVQLPVLHAVTLPGWERATRASRYTRPRDRRRRPLRAGPAPDELLHRARRPRGCGGGPRRSGRRSRGAAASARATRRELRGDPD